MIKPARAPLSDYARSAFYRLSNPAWSLIQVGNRAYLLCKEKPLVLPTLPTRRARKSADPGCAPIRERDITALLEHEWIVALTPVPGLEWIQPYQVTPAGHQELKRMHASQKYQQLILDDMPEPVIIS